MKILVTGTAGFIGFHTAQRLLNDGHTVTGVDNINDYYDPGLKYRRLQATGIETVNMPFNTRVNSHTQPGYSFYRLNLEDAAALDTLFEKGQFDVVVHLAAQAGVRYSVENPHAYINSNITGFLNILESSRKHEVGHLVFASSSSVYGMNKQEIFSTSDPVDHPVSLYAASKRSNELMAHVYSNIYGLPVTGLRFFTVYGPWGRPDMALFLFTKAILCNQPINVYNNGLMLRDFTYVDDIVEGIQRVMQHPPEGKADQFQAAPDPSFSYAPYRIFNIGNNAPVKLLDFIQILEKELGKEAIKNFMPLQAGDVYKTYADVSPLSEELGYRPSTPLEKGVKAFVDWYKSFYGVD